MVLGLPRTFTPVTPGDGLLRAEHFQLAYATNDVDRACELFRRQLGIAQFRRLEGQLPKGGQIRVELAWVGPVMYELLSASGPGSAIYMDRLPPGPGFAIRHHHMGFLLDSTEAWDALIVKAAAADLPVPYLNDNPGFLRSCFVDAQPLGHYLEYIWPEPAGLEFLLSVPRN
ncbi:VOC family protein [Sphingomonas sp. 35-24ZXX]|uniref:VOC family protein n=1 Tax=Sphingomonas sp. 35-24ZXX TaxID=1545915 RepID=UPI00053BE688|nr:VOC family protein [Sphingomonas sp. 35-24ZXX]